MLSNRHRLNLIRAAHFRCLMSSMTEPEPLPKRSDTKPINFEVLYEHPCPECGEPTRRGYCSDECRKRGSEMHASIKISEAKARAKRKTDGRGRGSRTAEKALENMDGFYNALPDVFSCKQAAEIWGITYKGAQRRLDRLRNRMWVDVCETKAQGKFVWKKCPRP